MFVKKFILKQWEGQSDDVNADIVKRFGEQIQSIEAYIKSYHYTNFD